jgi:hypothetical protein
MTLTATAIKSLCEQHLKALKRLTQHKCSTLDEFSYWISHSLDNTRLCKIHFSKAALAILHSQIQP